MPNATLTRRRILSAATVGGMLATPLVSRWAGGYREWFRRRRSDVTVTIEEFDESVRAGEHVGVTSTVANEGDSAVEATVDLIVGHDPQLDGRITTTLEPGESRTLTQGFDTFPTLTDEEFPVRVEASGDADERTVRVAGASELEGTSPDGDLAVTPDAEVLFEVDGVDPDTTQRAVWWVDGERAGDSMGPWPANYYAETGAHYWRERFEEPGTAHVAAAILPAEGEETYAAHWEVEVDDGGKPGPSIEDARPGERTIALAENDAVEFELDASDPEGELDRVVWWLTQADVVLDVSDLEGETDTATLAVDGDGICHTCHVTPWVLCEDGRFATLADTWELRDAGLEDDEDGELEISIVDTNAPVDGGEYLEVIVEVANVADSPAADELELLVGADRELSDTQAVSVEPGESGTATLGFETYPVQRDDEFTVRVEGNDDADETEVLVVGRG